MSEVRLPLTQVSQYLAWVQTLVWCVRVDFLGRQEQNDEAGK